ncbi:MAG: SRPBCC domain-containing protein [Planctomycetales bacterium]|nr:SRPBCC domain-containing protein [Planctomycetales bacterium]
MKYMLLIYGDEQCYSDAEREACMIESNRICQKLESAGKFIAAAPLHSVTTATSLRVRSGKRMITDGPFAETTEQLGGYYVIDVADLDEAIDIASQLPPAQKGTVEIRPIFDISHIQEQSQCDMVHQRDLPYSQEIVFAAFSDPEQLKQWWGPKDFTNSFHEFDFRSGGHWKLTMHGPNGTDYPNHNVFRSISPEQIVIEHLPDPHFILTVTLTSVSANQTRLLWHSRFDNATIRDRLLPMCQEANEQLFDRLEAVLAANTSSPS